jgi:membrane associated rhomboid family serine protease
MAVPAVVMLGLWILIQFINSAGSIARTPETSGGGVAYLAHVGGFVAGFLLVKLFAAGARRRLASGYAR